MNRLSATTRITFGLSCLAVIIMVAAHTFGLLPNAERQRHFGRRSLVESLGIYCSLYSEKGLADQGNVARLETALKAIVSHNDDILSAGIRRADGELIIEVADHSKKWGQTGLRKSADAQMRVPITADGAALGNVEIQFRSLNHSGWLGYLTNQLVALVLFVGIASATLFYLYLCKMLRHLDPSKVVPDRVRTALDALSEGLLVLDKDERIVLANRAFSETVGVDPEQLHGCRVSELPWIGMGTDKRPVSVFPWQESNNENSVQGDRMLRLKSATGDQHRTFKVNTSSITSGDGSQRGTLASFHDITLIEKNRAELERMLDMLRLSRDEVNRQNHELQILATQDPLTGCLNRRSFFSEFESHFNRARSSDLELSCIMVDVDHFKLVNDQHGHAVGDKVLKQIAECLVTQANEGDFVCRYGGEEFSILLPDTNLENTLAAAERYRQTIENLQLGEVSVTASLGVSGIHLGAGDTHEMLNQADRSLYFAKRSGRNQIICWQDIPEDFVFEEVDATPETTHDVGKSRLDIPFHAVTALVSALSYRDSSTAEHSRRVADLSVALASELMSVSDAYVIEIAALLHDIGKIGVPDDILLKPGPLTDEEWKVMGIHDRIGVEILQSTFDCDQLTQIVHTHHAWFGGNPREPGLPIGNEIPLGARILAIVDAYDAIVSDRVYRKGRSQAAAFTELRRFAGVQFDPELVELFVGVVADRDLNRVKTLPPVSKQTALKIGMEIERLASVFDDRDFEGLGALAGRLKQTAVKDGVPRIAEVASQLEAAATNDPELLDLARLTNSLLELCRMTQNAYLKDSPELTVDIPD